MLLPLDSFKQFGELITHFLNSLAFHRNNRNNYMLAGVLNASEKIHTKEDNTTKYLFTTIYKNTIWQEEDTWKDLIQLIIRCKVKTAQILEIKKTFTDQKKAVNKFVNTFKYLMSDTVITLSKKCKEVTIEWVLKRFTLYFVKLNVQLDIAKRILLYFAHVYSVDHKVIHKLINQLERSKSFPLSESLSHQRACIIMKKIENKMKKCEGSLLCFCLKSSLSFISDLKVLRNLLLLNKKLYSLLMIPICKQVLLKLNIDLPLHHRVQIWETIVDVKNVDVNYEELKMRESLLSKATEGIIKMDVMRSNNKYIDKDSLTRILCSYAQYNKDINYCQGMNFVVSYLYLILKDETKTFNFLVQLIKKYNMQGLYTKDVPLLKQYFHIMSNLITTHYPKMAQLLKNENIKCDFFASTWFLTVFTYSVQFSKEEVPELMLLKIWDRFLTSGWKVVFRLGVYFTGEIEKLLISDCSNLIGVLQEYSKKEFLHANIQNVINAVNKIKVTNSMIESNMIY